MTKLFDHKVELIKEPKDAGLYDYNWSIREEYFRKTTDYFPYIHSVIFSIKSFELVTIMEFAKDKDLRMENFSDSQKKNQKIVQHYITGDHIHAELCLISEPTYDQSFQIFGQIRDFNNFKLTISSHSKYKFSASCISFDDENYQIRFTLDMPEAEFESLVKKIRYNSIRNAHLSLEGVDGFYTRWPEEHRANSIKILTNELVSNDEFFIRPDGCQVTPPVLGQRIHSMGISFSEHYKFDQTSSDW